MKILLVLSPEFSCTKLFGGAGSCLLCGNFVFVFVLPFSSLHMFVEADDKSPIVLLPIHMLKRFLKVLLLSVSASMQAPIEGEVEGFLYLFI